MFVCRGCLRNLTGTAAGSVRPRLAYPLQRAAGSVAGRRTYWGKDIEVDVRSVLADTSKPYRREKANEKKAADETERPEDHKPLEYENLNPASGDLGRQKYEKKLEANVKKHLSLMPDPYHIAQYISKALEKGSFDEALLMTRMASRNKKVEVSWNHLIDYQMKNRRLHAAVKLYNEMKKRAQIPNAKTYTIIFRGCAQSLHPKLAVSEATRIYNFMIKYGALKPNTIHMNAVLEVCARAGDLESLFTVLATANSGMRAPDAHTYTIVLNALRYDAGNASKDNMGLVDEEVKRVIQKNIQRARAIWVDVVTNWRGGKMLLDEHLVYAMGRVLATGVYQDNDAVLDLLEQTMQIPRFDKYDVQLPKPKPTLSDADPTGEAVAGPDTNSLSPKARKALAASAATASANNPNKTPLYAKPGNKTLSLALTVLTNLRKTSSARQYWSYFIQVLKLTPDAENFYTYLRTLAAGHASGQVARAIEMMPTELLGPQTFRRGLSACISDNLNHAAFINACRIFDIMTKTQRYPDALSLRFFLTVARGNTRHFYEPRGEGKLGHGMQIAAALDRMWEPFRILSGSLSYPEQTTRSPEEEMAKKRGDMQEITATARRMIAAIDRIVTDVMVDTQNLKLWRTRRIILQKAVERWIRKLYPDGPPPEERERERKQVLEEEAFDKHMPREAARQSS